MSALFVVVGLGVILWIFSTMPAGRRLLGRLRVPVRGSGAPKREDRDYLLRVCDGDAGKVDRLLAHERRNQPDMTEAQAYRRAIRRYLRDK